MQATFHIKRERIAHFHMEHYNRLGGFLHFHSHIELLLVQQGEVEVWINDAKETVQAGQLAVVPCFAPHHFESNGNTVACTDLFVPAFLCPEFAEALGNKQPSYHVVRDEKAMLRVRNAVAELEREDLNSIEQIGHIQVILGTVLGQLSLTVDAPRQDNDLPAKLLLYINEHYREELSVATLALALGYTANHLSKCFRACFHVGIGHYINTVRLKNALALLREQKSITECALESGFPSLRTFYRCFSEEFGCTPREYLKKEQFS
ncbi:MAG: AraC family transcriptional regulator [Clostridia bacterium]|nr:AraC family transcriptional regulator [Clostridia bacterium]